jgi:hypothetical protein
MFIFFESFFDERFEVHRLKATRFAAVTTVVAMGAYVAYEAFTRDVIRLDLMGFLGILAVAKVLGMVYYRYTD